MCGEGKACGFKDRIGGSAWRFEEGALVTDQVGSMIGREFEWPALSELSFDLDWKSMPGMDVVICGDRVREYNAVNGYKLRLYQNYAHLYRKRRWMG